VTLSEVKATVESSGGPEVCASGGLDLTASPRDFSLPSGASVRSLLCPGSFCSSLSGVTVIAGTVVDLKLQASGGLDLTASLRGSF
jgi:hypothetical protein